jgi:hypothetical protein
MRWLRLSTQEEEENLTQSRQGKTERKEENFTTETQRAQRQILKQKMANEAKV